MQAEWPVRCPVGEMQQTGGNLGMEPEGVVCLGYHLPRGDG